MMGGRAGEVGQGGGNDLLDNIERFDPTSPLFLSLFLSFFHLSLDTSPMASCNHDVEL